MMLALLNGTSEISADKADKEMGKVYSSSMQQHHSNHSFAIG
jgi:hypothetical protein